MNDLNNFDPIPQGELQLDPGIRRYVLLLRSEGVETFESCQAGIGHCFLEPTVRFHGNSVEGYRAFAVAMNFGLPVYSLRRYYQVNAGQLEGPWWEMTFRDTDLSIVEIARQCGFKELDAQNVEENIREHTAII